jgi:hypothetical protein
VDALMRVMRDECIDAPTPVSPQIHFFMKRRAGESPDDACVHSKVAKLFY